MKRGKKFLQVTKISVLKAEERYDLKKLQTMARMINQVYKRAENGLYSEDAQRITIQDLQNLIKNEEIAVAKLKEKIIGTIRVSKLDKKTGELGLLSVAKNYQGQGYGKRLITYAEQYFKRKKMTYVQLELLVPVNASHPFKEALKKWYIRLGYKPLYKTSIDKKYPHIKEKLAVPCQFIVFQKQMTENVIKS